MAYEIRPVVTGQTIRQQGWGRTAHYFAKPGALFHLTDGTPYSRTGRNLKALCGVSVRPELVEFEASHRVCRRCEEARP